MNLQMYPKISIITPSFNQGQYIEQTICSVLDQGYPNLEYIVIDGGSTDNTVDILKHYSDRISYWASEPDKGQTDAINKGFQLATGEIINWLNSDDYYAPNSLLQIASAFQDSKVKAVTTNVHHFGDGCTEWDDRTGTCSSSAEYIARSFNNQPGTFFRKDVWDNYFPIPTQFRYTMDQYLWFCFWLEHGTEALRNEAFTTAWFRRHADSKTQESAKDTLFHYLGKTFFNEHNLLFWSYFNQRNKERAKVISTYFWNQFSYESQEVRFPKHLRTDKTMEDQIFHLYLFELLLEDYRIGNFHRLQKNIRYVDKGFLTEDQKRTLQKMKLASFGRIAVKTYRSFYWKLKNTSR